MSYEYRQSIGGVWHDASNGKTWDVLNPATEEVIRTVPFGKGDDCRLAIDAAAGAFPSWSKKGKHLLHAPSFVVDWGECRNTSPGLSHWTKVRHARSWSDGGQRWLLHF